MRKYVIGLILFLFVIVAICWAAVTTNIGVNLTISGLGNNTVSYSKSFSATEPNAITQQYRVLDVNGTAEVVDKGDVSTVYGMIIACVDDGDVNTTGGLFVDCNYVSAFTSDLHVKEGEVAYFKPSGVVRVKGTTTEKPIYEYVILGHR